jgi:hypothetical protein
VRVNPGLQDNRRLIAQHYPWFLATYDGYKHHICRADAARYFYMFHYGGVYLDLDFVCRKGFTQLVDDAGLGGGGGGSGGGSGGGDGDKRGGLSRWWSAGAGKASRRRRGRRLQDEGGAGAEAEAEAARIAEAAAAAASQHQSQQADATTPPPPPPPAPPALRRYQGDSGPSARGVTLAVMGDGECIHCLPNAFLMSEKAHPFWKTVIEELQMRAKDPVVGLSLYTPGPGVRLVTCHVGHTGCHQSDVF